MPLESLLTFGSISFALAVSPGPSWAYVLGATGGSRPAAHAGAAIAGNATGIMGHIVIAVAGLLYLASVLPAILAFVKWIGAAYLIYLGARAVFRTGKLSAASVVERTWLQVFRGGFLVNLLNPKVSVLMLALLPQFIDFGAHDVASQVMTLGGIHVVLASCVLTCLAATAVQAQRWMQRTQRDTLVLSRVAGAILILFGIRLAVS